MILFILYILAIIPIANLGLNSIILEKVHIPDFLITEGTKTLTGFTLISATYLALIYINYRLFFLLPLVASNNNSFFRNAMISLRITKIEKLRVPFTFITIGIILFMASLVSMLFSFVLILYSVGNFLKNRSKQFVILNIIGASKGQFNKLIFFENIIISIFALIVGIISGMVFSKIFLMVSSEIYSSEPIVIDFSPKFQVSIKYFLA